MKRKYALVLAGVVVFCVLAVLVIYERHGPPTFVPSNFNTPPPSPTPCIVKNVGTNPPPHVCLDNCGHLFNDVPQGQPNHTDVLCCPVGMAFGETPGTCVKPCPIQNAPYIGRRR